ncbi:MAG: hypothetical protein E7591_01590 [Ruminococcaceae bacterium]|nr:hypothetical protein [Oscillospiraceae bacterium]
MFKRILSMLLCLLTLCGLIPMMAFGSTAAAEAVSSDIKISNFNLTTKSMTEPKIDKGEGMFYDFTYITIDGVKYYPGDQFPAGALKVGDYRTVTIQFTPISGCYFVTESDGTSYAGKVTIGNQELTAYVNSSGILKVMFRMYINSPDITSNITFTGVEAPVNGGDANLTGKGKFSHSALNITMVDYAFRLPGKNQWYFYTEDKLDSSFSYEKFALCVMYEVDPAYNITGFVSKITWNGKGVDAYAPLTNGKGYAIYFYCDIADELTQVTITDIEPPVHGATPDRTGTAPKGIEITKIQYIKASDRSGEYEGTFDAIKHVGKDYIELGIEIRAIDGYTFNPKYLKVFCNGMTSTVYVNRGDGKYVFVFPLTIAQKHVDMVHVTNIDPAVDGATPDREGTVKESDMVELTKVQYVMMSDRSGEYMGKFDAKKHVGKDAIELGIELKAKPGYVIDNATVVNVNGDFSSVLVKRDEGRIVYIIPDLVIEERFKNPFTDVKESDWYYSSVLWAVQNGITSGTTATTFSPQMVCTRSQAVQFLWNAAGNPEPTTTKNPFTDVKSDAWYYKAVLWAVEKGITNGTSATTFAPDMKCSRSQIVTFLWNAQGKPTVEATNPFTDVKAKDWFYNSVMWAVENGITTGTSATTFAPVMKCSRSQIVTFICRSYSDAEFAIISQPVNYQMESSQEDATFTVRVAGGTAPYTYTWYVLKDNDEYTEVHKTAAGKYTFSYEFSDYDFELYRNISVYCVISDVHGQSLKTVYVTVISKDGSNASSPLTIITQPKNYQMQSSQEDAAFAVSVSGGVAPYTYTWYVFKDGGEESFVNTTTAVADTFKYNFSDYDFEQFRDIYVWCVIKDAAGQTLQTNYVYALQK